MCCGRGNTQGTLDTDRHPQSTSGQGLLGGGTEERNELVAKSGANHLSSFFLDECTLYMVPDRNTLNNNNYKRV